MKTRAVLFDWRGTLVVSQTMSEWVADALHRLNRSQESTQLVIERILAASGPQNRLEAPGIDSDAEFHRATLSSVFSDAGLDNELSAALDASEADPSRNPFASDVAPILRLLNKSGLHIGIVSDIHFDIRPAFANAGLDQFVSSYSLSYEIGTQKPDPRMYQHALSALNVRASEALMVGDRSVPDGGAIESGIPCLLLPPLRSVAHQRLSLVLSTLGISPSTTTMPPPVSE